MEVQDAVASLPGLGGAASTGLSEGQLHELSEYEKIVRFRDAIYSGSHPQVKLPAHLAAKSPRKTASPIASLTRAVSPPTTSTRQPTTNGADKEAEYGGQNRQGHVDVPSNQPRAAAAERPISTLSATGKANKSEINPVLLEKSDDLIKAELQLQRQRLERNLKEQVEQRRLSVKAASQTSESHPEFDLSEVLSKAMEIVPPLTVSDAEKSVGAGTSASDSFDENTFYSSQHNSPEPSISPRERETSERSKAIPAATHDGGPSPTRHQHEPRDVVMADAPLPATVVPGLQELASKQALSSLHGTHPPQSANPQSHAARGSLNSGAALASGAQQPASANRGTDGVDASRDAQSASRKRKVTSPVQDNGGDARPVDAGAHGPAANASLPRRRQSVEEPDVRNFNLSPHAPQPVRVSPLAMARGPQQTLLSQEESTTADYSPLRRPTAGSAVNAARDPSQGDRRKENRKAGQKPATEKYLVADARPDSPVIKREPRSSSPFASAPLPRPHKRQRQAYQPSAGLDYDEPQYDEARDEPQEQHSAPIAHPRRLNDGLNATYVVDDEPINQARHMDDDLRPFYVGDGRYYYEADDEVEPPHYRRVPGAEPVPVTSRDARMPPPSPSMVKMPYQQYEQRPVRPESVVNPYSKEFLTPIPGSTPVGIRIDDDKSPSPVVRGQSPDLMVPLPRYSTRVVTDEYGHQYTTLTPSVPDVARQPIFLGYEYRPPRPVSRPVRQVYKRPPSPQYVPQRRVVALPETAVEPQPYYQQREYSTRPLPARTAADGYEMEYSTRPLPARVAADDYEREYSARPLPARAAADGYQREYSARPLPARTIVDQKEYSTRTVPARAAAEDYIPEAQQASIRQRGFSTRPAMTRSPNDGYARVAEPAQRRQLTHFEEAPPPPPPRQYTASRVGSVRPEAMWDYATRAEPVRRAYAASVRPERHREVPPPPPSRPMREYSMRPPEREYVPTSRMTARGFDERGAYPPPREQRREVYEDEARQGRLYR